MTKRLVTVGYATHPHELLVCLLAILSGLYGLLDVEVSQAIANVFQFPWRRIFYGVLVLGGLVGAVGLYWRDRLFGLLVERVGMFVMLIGFAVYAAALLMVGTSWLFALYPLAFVVTTALRIVQIGRHFKLLTSYYADHPDAVPYASRERGDR